MRNRAGEQQLPALVIDTITTLVVRGASVPAFRALRAIPIIQAVEATAASSTDGGSALLTRQSPTSGLENAPEVD
jgi:hypothetical protein